MVGAGLPLVVGLWGHLGAVVGAVSFSVLLFLALVGALGASAGGAPVLKAAIRVCFWGALAMLLTALVGHWFA